MEYQNQTVNYSPSPVNSDCSPAQNKNSECVDSCTSTLRKQKISGEKPFNCHVCSKCFLTEEYLQRHTVCKYIQGRNNFIAMCVALTLPGRDTWQSISGSYTQKRNHSTARFVVKVSNALVF